MDKVSGKLTVYFEDPFWVGVFERIEDGKLSVGVQVRRFYRVSRLENGL